MQAKISPRHQAALEFAEAGIPVFPCVVGGKAPATENGFHDASIDLEQINAWWSKADFNVAFCPEHAGWAVVDLDLKNNGPSNWETLPGVGETYTVRTPGGGLHLYLAGSLPNSAGKLAHGVDTRGVGGYVLLPPSRLDEYEGRAYSVEKDIDLAPVPAWLSQSFKVSDRVQAAPDVELDLPANLQRATALLTRYAASGHVAVAGQGGNNRTFAVAAEVSNLGLSKDRALDLLEEIWNPHCVPPWDHDDLAGIVSNAFEYAQNDPGVWAVPPASEVFGAALDKLAITPVPEGRSRFHAENEEEQEQGKDPQWLIPNLMVENTLVLISGVTQSFKSFIAEGILLSLSTGKPTFAGTPLRQGLVFYAASEGRTAIKTKRRRAWKLLNGVDKVEGFYVMPAPMLAVDADVQEFGREIERVCAGREALAVVIDTASNAMVGWNENDPSDVARFVAILKSLANALKCTFIVIHHKGKDNTRGPRGASNWRADFDTVIDVQPHHDEDGKPASTMVRVAVTKHKDAEEPAEPWYLEGVKLGDSLAFQPVTQAEYMAVVKGKNPLAPTAVGAALLGLRAVGADHAVSTAVLAEVLTAKHENQSVEAQQEAQKKTGRLLSKLAGSTLLGYAVKSGSEWTWYLPD